MESDSLDNTTVSDPVTMQGDTQLSDPLILKEQPLSLDLLSPCLTEESKNTDSVADSGLPSTAGSDAIAHFASSALLVRMNAVQ